MIINKLFIGAAIAALSVAFAPQSASAASCVGNCGAEATADGVVALAPIGTGAYQYVSTNGGVTGAGSLGVGGETNGSQFTTTTFTVNAGAELDFYFNYITSDGAGFADYGFAQLQDASSNPVATLFSARTQPTGDIVPGFGLPPLLATLTPATSAIIPGGPVFSPLGASSGQCFSAGCGYTGWIGSTYIIPTAGTYQLTFGVTNFADTAFDTALAFAGVTVNGNPIPEPAAFATLGLGLGLLGLARRRRS